MRNTCATVQKNNGEHHGEKPHQSANWGCTSSRLPISAVGISHGSSLLLRMVTKWDGDQVP